MSNTGYNGGYFIYPAQRHPRNPAIPQLPSPANQREQFWASARDYPSGPPPLGFRDGSLHTQPALHTRSQQAAGIHTGQFSHMLTSVPGTQMAPVVPMERYPMSPGAAFVTATELQMEPRAFYSQIVAEPPSFARPNTFGPVRENGFDQRLSSPSNHGSPQESESPSIAGSGVVEKAADQPYAKLIFEALKGAPNHSMVLKEIYAWFEKNTDKPLRAPGGKQGWKNSIRHNLSMNEAFTKVVPANLQDREGNKGCIWRLAPKALAEDTVLSTTRYRPKTSSKRRQSSHVLHQRQGHGGRILKRSPPRDTGSPQLDPTFGLDDLSTQHSLPQESYATMSYCSFSSGQPYSAAPFATDMTQTDALFPSLPSDSNMMDSAPTGVGFDMYHYSGTPASAASTQPESILPELTGNRYSPFIKAEDPEIEGVSDRASGFDLFSDSDQGMTDHKRSMQIEDMAGGAVHCVTTTTFDEMTNFAMMSDPSWQLDPYGQGDNNDYAQFHSRL